MVGIIDYAVPIHCELEKSYGGVAHRRRIPSVQQDALQLDIPYAEQSHTEDVAHVKPSFDDHV
jgi:hypothetical protein